MAERNDNNRISTITETYIVAVDKSKGSSEKEGKTKVSSKGKGKGSGGCCGDTCQCFDDDDVPVLGDYIPECKSGDCIETGCNNFRETKGCCWCPLKYLSFSMDHCIVASSNGKVCDCGYKAKKRSREIDEKLKKNDLCCRDNTLCGCLACPFTLTCCGLGCVAGILNVFCSITCCTVGCCLWCCDKCKTHKVGPA